MGTPKTLPKAPIDEGLIATSRYLLAALKGLRPDERMAVEEAHRRAVIQVGLLNDKLYAMTKQLSAGGVILHSEFNIEEIEAEIAELQASINTPSSYILPIAAHKVSISGTTFLPITLPVTVSKHEKSKSLSFYWEAGNSGVNARYRLVDATTSVTLLSGFVAAPFSRSLLFNPAGVYPMPTAGDEVRLDVSFSGAGSGGEITLLGPVSWGVQ